MRAHISSFYDKLIDVQPVITNGKAMLPTGTGLGTKLKDDLFVEGTNGYRRSECAH